MSDEEIKDQLAQDNTGGDSSQGDFPSASMSKLPERQGGDRESDENKEAGKE